jgi:hypothetical protein
LLSTPDDDVPRQIVKGGHTEENIIEPNQRGKPPADPVRIFSQYPFPISICIGMHPINKKVLEENEQAGKPEFAVVNFAE